MPSFLVVKKSLELSGDGSISKMLVGRQTRDLSAASGPVMTAMRKHIDMKVNVTFDMGGLSEDIVSSYVLGSTYSKLPEVSAASHIFEGWYTMLSTVSPAFDKKIETSSVVELSNIRLYAKWEKPTVNDGTSFDVSVSTTYSKVGIYSAAMWKPTASTMMAATSAAFSLTGPDHNPQVVSTDTSAQTSAIYIDWGDGCVEKHLSSISQLVHTYSTPGVYRAKVSNNISSIAFGGSKSGWCNTSLTCQANNHYTLKDVVQLGTRVTSLPDYMFYYCGISSISFLSTYNGSATSLPSHCFGYCKNLTSMSSLPTRFKSLGGYCFYYSGLSGVVDLRGTGLTGLTNDCIFYGCQASTYKFPATLSASSFGRQTFYQNSKLTSIDLPSTLTHIGYSAFGYCTSLMSVSIPSKVTYIDNFAFVGCSRLTSVQYNASALKDINSNAFQYCYGLRDLSLPSTVRFIGGNAFANCYSSYASSLVLPSALTSIGVNAYQYCYNLKSVVLPSALTSIGSNAFAGCYNLSSITDLRLTAQTSAVSMFGSSTSLGNTTYTGYRTRGSNVLSIYAEAEDYDTGNWLDPLQNASKCGFGIQYIDPENAKYCTITFDAGEGTVGTTSVQVMYAKRLGTLPTPTAPESTPYFGGWYTEENGGGTRYGASSRCPKQETLVLHAYYGTTPLMYYTVDLNDQWQQSTSQANPDSTLYDGVYESSSNYNVGNGYAKMYARIVGYETFSIYIRSYAESNCDYVVAMNVDTDVTSLPSASTSGVKASTSGKQNSGTAIANYTKVTYDGLDGGSHYICIVYRKDGSVNSGNDRGYVLIPKT